MLRLVFLAPVALAFVAPLAAPPVPTAAAAPCADVFPHAPAVVYEVSGYTLAGPYDLELAVYNDGFARLSSSTSGTDGKCQLVYTGTAAGTLLANLSAVGAFQLCDTNSNTTDLPLATLTLMRPKTDTRAHTFSWWPSDSGYQQVELLLAGFQASWFPNF